MLAVLGAFGPTVGHDFIALDDDIYVTDNPGLVGGLSAENIAWAFSTLYAGFWHPVTWLSYLLDYELFGLDATGYHASNVLLHLLTSVFLFLVLREMTGAHGRSLLVALLFAVHPLRVESVAWISERKDLLSGLFMVLTLLAYSRFASTRSRESYALALLAFALGLMSKPMLVTVPFVLLLLDGWPLRRAELSGDWRSCWGLVVEKLPFFALSAGSSALTLIAQSRAGAISSLEAMDLPTRVTSGLVSYSSYLNKSFLPVDLAVVYPHTFGMPPTGAWLLALVLLGTITGVALWQARERPALIVGWLWFAGMLFPVSGIVQFGTHAMADRNTYLPSIGLFLALVFGAADLLPRRIPERLWAGASALLVVALCVLSSRQADRWADSVRLFERTLAVTSENYLIHNNLCVVLLERGRHQEGIEQCRRAVTIRPGYAEAWANLGLGLHSDGQTVEAIHSYEASLSLSPDRSWVHSNLGSALLARGEQAAALRHFLRAVDLDPESPDAHNNLAWVLATAPSARLRDGAQALRHARVALDLAVADDPGYLDTLAAAYAESGQFSDAVTIADRALAGARAAGNAGFAAVLEQRRSLYLRSQPYRDLRQAP